MKKILALFLVISLVASAIAACNNTEQTSASTETTVKTESTSNSTTVTTQTTQTTIATTLGYYYEYSVVTSEESAEIQSKIDRNIYNKYVPSKVIITCGEERDVPYLLVSFGRYADPKNGNPAIVDGYGTLGGFERTAKSTIETEKDLFPAFCCSSLNEISFFLNDSLYSTVVNLINENGENIEADGPGRYYAYAFIDYLGPKLMYNGKVYFSPNEMHYAAFFIVEITE